MYRRDKPSAVDDLGQTGDPWATGILHDRPNFEERQRWADNYDQNAEDALATLGITRSHPDFDAYYQSAINADVTHTVEPMSHGHELPLSKRDTLLYAPEGEWRNVQDQRQRGDAMMAEYQRRNPDLANEPGLDEAVAAAAEYFDQRGLIPSEHLSDFLNDVAAFHRGGVRPQYSGGDSHRTGGIGTGTYIPATSVEHPEDDAGMIGELRRLQRERGLY
jgi:hypothetical protein